MQTCKKIFIISCLLIFGKILFISTQQMVNASGCEETFSGKGGPFSYSAEQVAYAIFTNATALYSGDVIYSICGEIDGQSTSLDSIIFENIDNGTKSLFRDLPVQTRYQINLTTNELISPTGIVNISSNNYFKVIKNIQGEINIQCNNNVPFDAFLTVNNINGQVVFHNKLKNIKSGNIISIHVPNSGIYILSITTPYCKKSFKVFGSNENSNNSCYITNRTNGSEFASSLPIEARLKNAYIQNSNNFSFQNGDSIRVSAYKHGYFSYPVGKRISGPDSVTFVFFDGDVPIAPVAAFTASGTNITFGNSIQFTDQSTNSPTSWSWNFGDGGTSTEQNPLYTYLSTGIFTVSLIAANTFGSDTETKTNYITVSPAGSAPIAAFTASPTSVTPGQNVQFTDQSTNSPVSWSWNFGDGGTSAEQNPLHTYSTAGTFTVSLTATNTYGSDTRTITNYIIVNAAASAIPVADFTASPTSLIVYESVQFTDQSSNTPASWRWTFGDRGTSTLQNPLHTYYTAGTYEVSLTATNASGSDIETKTNYITVSCNTGTVTDYEGNVYNTIKLGDQWWMAENLKVTKYNDGAIIPLVTDETAWQGLSTHAYCWQNNDEVTYKNTYGALYNWYTVNTGNLCPTGWHVPTRPEWMVLDNYLILYGYNYDNSLTGNKIGKALASGSGWSFSSTVGAAGNTDYPAKRNVTCFTALPGGYRYYFGPFMGVGTEGHWWTSTVTTPTSQAFSYYLASNFISLNYSGMDKRCGYSVRCMKD